MARLEGVPVRRAGLFTRIVYATTRRILGKIPEPMTLFAHHGSIFAAVSGFEFALQRAKRVDPKLKALAGMKAGQRVGCPY